jgi:hypothetical protein
LVFVAEQTIKEENQEILASMPECRNTGKKVIPASVFTGSRLSQSGIGIPASWSVLYRWLQIIPALPSFSKKIKFTSWRWFLKSASGACDQPCSI